MADVQCAIVLHCVHLDLASRAASVRVSLLYLYFKYGTRIGRIGHLQLAVSENNRNVFTVKEHS
jgi:hypothetical protein